MYSKGTVAVIDFPFSDLKTFKKRPVFILAEKQKDVIVCAVTSNPSVNGVAVSLSSGQLPFRSSIKYWQIQTMLKSDLRKPIGTVTGACHEQVLNKLFSLLSC